MPRPGPDPRPATVWRCSQLEDGRRLLRHQVERRLEGFILSELVLGDQLGQHPGIDAAGGFIVLSSRLSIELVQKAAAIGCPMLVAVSAPTHYALRAAAVAGMTLLAVARDDSFEVFTHPQRIAT